MYEKRKRDGAQGADNNMNLIDYFMNSPIAVAELGVLAMIGID